jgi:MoaA/NifB/PqqE/SkfB family radical SAM enzyme
MPKPVIDLWLELETRCNLTCRFCYNYWKNGRSKEPSRCGTAETVLSLRRLLDAVDCRQIACSGGEPLLRPDLLEILNSIQDYGVPVIVTTNGLLLTREKINQLLGIGVVGFQVPLHSHLEHVHDRLSGGRCWRSALRAIIRVRESTASIVPVFVATRWNLSHFPAVLDICSHLGIDRIIFNRFVPSGLGSINQDEIGVPTDAELLALLCESDLRASGHGIKIHLGVPIRVPEDLYSKWKQVELDSCPVGVGQRRWTIGSDLSIRRCNQSGASIGNLLHDGTERLLQELSCEVRERRSHTEIKPCQILEAPRLTQISASF